MQLTVTDTLTAANNIPEATLRKQLVIRNTGANVVYFGWEATVSAAAGANQGVPLEPDEFLTFAGPELDLRSTLFLVCATGQSTTVNYTQHG